MQALEILKKATSKSLNKEKLSDKEAIRKGEKILESGKSLGKKEIWLDGAENSNRKVVLLKVKEAYQIFKDLVNFHGVEQLLFLARQQKKNSLKQIMKEVAGLQRSTWINAGGQLIPSPAIEDLLSSIRNGKINDWEAVHQFYHEASDTYPIHKARHAIIAMLELHGTDAEDFDQSALQTCCQQALATREWMTKGIYESRWKDYENPFRKMVYATTEEMNKVVGPFKENLFIRQQQEALQTFQEEITGFLKKLKA